MPSGTHEYVKDPRNDNILIYINGEIIPRQAAKISVFDSGFLLGDGVSVSYTHLTLPTKA